MYNFNENKTYNNFNMGSFGLLLNKIKIPAVLFWTKYLLFMPNMHIKIYTVIGKKI